MKKLIGSLVLMFGLSCLAQSTNRMYAAAVWNGLLHPPGIAVFCYHTGQPHARYDLDEVGSEAYVPKLIGDNDIIMIESHSESPDLCGGMSDNVIHISTYKSWDNVNPYVTICPISGEVCTTEQPSGACGPLLRSEWQDIDIAPLNIEGCEVRFVYATVHSGDTSFNVACVHIDCARVENPFTPGWFDCYHNNIGHTYSHNIPTVDNLEWDIYCP